jgi:hypothetical protein
MLPRVDCGYLSDAKFSVCLTKQYPVPKLDWADGQSMAIYILEH